MQEIHDIVYNLLFILGPGLRESFIFLLGYAEGLPVIGSFVPGGTIAILIGSLSVEGYVNQILAVNLIAIGSFLGDLTGFFFGNKIQNWKLVKRFVKNDEPSKAWDLFDRHIAFVIIFGKLLPVVRSTPALFAGARNIKPTKYAIYAFIASYVWAIFGIYVGSFLAEWLGDQAIPVIIFTVLGILFTTWLVNKFQKIRKSKIKNNPTK
jgi:membrane protein DedA with SNARE-associated domain